MKEKFLKFSFYLTCCVLLPIILVTYVPAVIYKACAGALIKFVEVIQPDILNPIEDDKEDA